MGFKAIKDEKTFFPLSDIPFPLRQNGADPFHHGIFVDPWFLPIMHVYVIRQDKVVAKITVYRVFSALMLRIGTLFTPKVSFLIKRCADTALWAALSWRMNARRRSPSSGYNKGRPEPFFRLGPVLLHLLSLKPRWLSLVKVFFWKFLKMKIFENWKIHGKNRNNKDIPYLF